VKTEAPSRGFAGADDASAALPAKSESGQHGVRLCVVTLVVGMMAIAMLPGCAVAMLGGAARSGGGSASAQSSGGGTASTGRTTSGGGTAGSGGTGTSAGKAASGAAVSDSSISAGVRSRFGANSTLKALKIGVDTHDGIVTLKGQVNTLAEKSTAQAEARVVNGVTGVNNQLTVR
jgi:hypothetical protein